MPQPALPSRRRWLKVVLIVVVFLVLGLGVLVAFAPAIASGLAPGIAKSTAKGMIAGELSIGSTSLSWGGPQKFSTVEIRDPKGGLVASVNAEASAGLWSLITGGKDLGTLTVSGKAELIKSPDGTTNLQRATAEPAGAAPPKPKATSNEPFKLPGGLLAKVKINGVDVRYKEVDASGKAIAESSVTDLKGDANISTVGAASAGAKLQGAVGDGKTNGSLKLDIKLDNFADAQGRLTLGTTKADVNIDAGQLPVALLDALGNLKGMLVDALGPTASATVAAKGDASAGAALVGVQSENITANLSLKLENGRVVAEKPGAVSVRSTKFAAKVPGLSDALAKAGVSIEIWPSVEAKVSSLTLPLPKAGAGEADLRGIGLDAEVKTSAVTGRITPPAAAAPGGGSEPGAAPTAQLFSLAPATLKVTAPDLASGVTISGATFATLDKQSAGTLNLEIQAAGLLDGQGRLALRGGLPGRITGSASAKGVATSLAQPFLAAANAPIDVGADIGPTVDVGAKFETAQAEGTGGTGAAGTAPIDLEASVQSRNVKVLAPLRLAGDVLTSRGEATVEIVSAGGAVRRVLAQRAESGSASSLRVSGDGGVKLSVSDLRVPLGTGGSAGGKNGGGQSAGGKSAGMDLSAIGGSFSVQVSRLELAMAGSEAGPIGLQEMILAGRLAPGKETGLTVSGAFSHEGRPFTLQSNLMLPGLEAALKSTEAGALIPGVGPLRVVGSINLEKAPMSLAKLAPAAPAGPPGPKAPGQGDAGGGVVGELVRGVVGDTASVRVVLEQAKGGGEGFSVSIEGAGLKAQTSGDFGGAALRLAGLDVEATVRPETVRGILKAAGQDKGDLGQIAMRGPARLELKVEPLTIPMLMAGGAPSPDWMKAGTVQAAVSLREPLVVAGIPMKDKRLTGGLKDLRATATVPLAMLAEGGKTGEPIRATLNSKLLLDEGRAIGDLAASATIPRDLSAVDAAASITGLNTVAVDGVLDQPLLVSGALGETADVSIAMRQDLKAVRPADGAAPIRAKVQVSKSPRLTTEPLDVLMDSERIALMAPAKVSWTIDPTWADRYLLAPKEAGQAQTFRLLAPTAVALDVRKLVISQSDVRGGLTVAGPLKPGVFAVDLSASIPKVQMQQLSAEPGAARPAPITLDNITAEVKSAPDNSLSINLRSASVAGGGVSSAAPVTLVGGIKDVAAANGAFNSEGFVADIELKADSAPTALIDAAAGMGGRLVDLLGPQIKAAITTTKFTRRPGGRGEIAVDIRSYRPSSPEPASLVSLSAPVLDGVISVAPAKPFRIELAEFSVGEGSSLVQGLGIIASMTKQRLNSEGKPDPVRITSANLRLPLGARRSELRQLNGEIDVALGTVNYTLRSDFTSLIQSNMMKDLSRGVQQPPMKPFRIVIRNGEAQYDGVEIPLKIGLGLGEEIVMVPLKGKVNLVEETIDAEASLPLELVSGSVLSVLPVGLSGVRGDLLSFLEKKDPKAAAGPADPKAKERADKARSISVPVRVHGPMGKPAFDVDVELFGQRSGGLLDNLSQRPGEAIKEIGDSIKEIGDLFKKPKK